MEEEKKVKNENKIIKIKDYSLLKYSQITLKFRMRNEQMEVCQLWCYSAVLYWDMYVGDYVFDILWELIDDEVI